MYPIGSWFDSFGMAMPLYTWLFWLLVSVAALMVIGAIVEAVLSARKDRQDDRF